MSSQQTVAGGATPSVSNDVHPHFETLEYADCAQRVAAFRNLNRESERTPAYFQWRYAGRPCAQGGYVTWALDAQGNQMAAASFIAHDFSVLGTRQKVGVVGDISVLPAYRGKGIARHLMSELRRAALARGLEACFVLPNPEVTSALQKAGFNKVGEIAREIRVLSLKSRLKGRFGVAGQLAAAFVDPLLGPARTRRGLASAQGYEASRVAEFGPDADGLWESIEKNTHILAVRNHAYLHWRFNAKPGSAYRIFEIRRQRELYGYVVFHIEDTLAVVDDFLVRDAAAARVLGHEVIEAVHSGRLAEGIQVRFIAATGLAVPWRGAGFVRRADVQLVMWSDAAPPPAPAEEWFVTPGDKDV